MADFKDFEAFESRQDLCPADEGNELGGEIEKLSGHEGPCYYICGRLN